MSKDLHATSTTVTLSVALYLLSSSVCPLWWSSLSEIYGRRTVFVSSFALHITFTFASGWTQNIATLSVLRLFSGGGAASAQAVGAGVVADIWKSDERGHAMSMFYLGPLVGPLFLPLVGGALVQRYGWRSIMWFLSGWGILVLGLILLFLPETLPAIRSVSDSRTSTAMLTESRKKSFLSRLKCYTVDPLLVIGQLRFPAIAIVVLNAALAFGSSYALNISMQSAFSGSHYRFSPTIVGLLFVPYSAGFVVASVFGGKWMDRIMVRAAIKAGRYREDGTMIYLPEDRLGVNLLLSFVVYPAALIWCGWTVQYGVHWTVPSIATFVYGGGVMLVFSATTTMLTEFTPKQSSSGVAVNNFVRNIFSCVSTVAAQPLIDAIGHGWLMTMIGLLTCGIGLGSMWLLKRKSLVWREKMEARLN